VPAVSDRVKVVTAMLVLYVVWGTTYLAIKVGLDAGLPPALFAGVRQIPAAAIMFGIALWRGSKLKITICDLRISVIAGILLIVGGQYFTFLAEQHVPSGISALVVALIPLWIALAESAFPDMQRPGRLGWLGLAIGFAGYVVYRRRVVRASLTETWVMRSTLAMAPTGDGEPASRSSRRRRSKPLPRLRGSSGWTAAASG